MASGFRIGRNDTVETKGKNVSFELLVGLTRIQASRPDAEPTFFPGDYVLDEIESAGNICCTNLISLPTLTAADIKRAQRSFHEELETPLGVVYWAMRENNNFPGPVVQRDDFFAVTPLLVDTEDQSNDAFRMVENLKKQPLSIGILEEAQGRMEKFEKSCSRNSLYAHEISQVIDTDSKPRNAKSRLRESIYKLLKHVDEPDYGSMFGEVSPDGALILRSELMDTMVIWKTKSARALNDKKMSPEARKDLSDRYDKDVLKAHAAVIQLMMDFPHLYDAHRDFSHLKYVGRAAAGVFALTVAKVVGKMRVWIANELDRLRA